MTHLIKPLVVAVKGKGVFNLLKRLGSISQRYGLSSKKVDHSLEVLARILQEFGCYATLPITSVALARCDDQTIKKYQEQGIEFAVHGYRHVDYSQLPLDEQKIHLEQAEQVFKQKGIAFEGFRGPYLRSNQHTVRALKEAGFAYDSSTSLVWDVDERYVTESYKKALDFYGAKPASGYLSVPFFDPEENLLRIPYCLPDDESLVERLRWSSPQEMEQMWPSMFRQIHQQGELFNLGLHPERAKDCANALTATLKEAAKVKDYVWFARLKEIAAWWKARFAAVVEISSPVEDVYQITPIGPEGTTLLLRGLPTESPTEVWLNGYRCVSDTTCMVQCDKRPFIGVSPNSPAVLSDFLRQQGYIAEVSSQPERYAFYVDCPSFSDADQRPLVAQIEAGDFPLVRLGRWPNGAHSAFCVTGDVDALTLWDYALRFAGR